MWGYTAVVCLLFSSWLFLYSPLRGIVFGAHQTQGPVVAPFIRRPKEEGSVSSPSFADGGDVAFRRGTHDAVPLKCRSCDSSWDWGRFGRWVYDANNRSSRWNPHWVEPCCDAEWLFRPWSTERFCREALRCGDLLFVSSASSFSDHSLDFTARFWRVAPPSSRAHARCAFTAASSGCSATQSTYTCTSSTPLRQTARRAPLQCGHHGLSRTRKHGPSVGTQRWYAAATPFISAWAGKALLLTSVARCCSSC
jgi:hypothetical protein